MTSGVGSSVTLRDVTAADLPILFEHQLDPDANRMAAFTGKDPSDRAAFMAHWTRILDDENITTQTILLDGQVAGSILTYEDEALDGPEVSYWIGKPYWGKGIATAALTAFLAHVTQRPLYARVAKDNVASIRVLQKCAFTISGEDKGFANARGEEIEEFILTLEGNGHGKAPTLVVR